MSRGLGLWLVETVAAVMKPLFGVDMFFTAPGASLIVVETERSTVIDAGAG